MFKMIATIVAAVMLAGIIGFLFITATDRGPDLEDVSQAAQPFVAGVAVEAGDKIKERIKNTPDEDLEKEAEILSGKLYHITKGAVKGQARAIIKDVSESDLAKDAHKAGKEITDKVVKPLAESAADSAVEALDQLDRAAREFRDFKTRNRDVIDSVTQGIGEVYKNIPRPPAGPPIPPPPPFDPNSTGPFPFPGPGPLRPPPTLNH
jgi:hypothetical protein